MKFKNSLLCASLCAMLMAPQAMMAMEVVGLGAVPISSGDPQSVKSIAEKQALASAVVNAVKKKFGTITVASDDPRVQELITQRATFLKNPPKIERDRSDSAMYAVSVTLDIDDKKFTEALTDVKLGALKGNVEKLGSVVIFVDEAVKINTASASDVPMEERIDYKRDNSKSYKENTAKSASSASASSASISDKESASYSAKSSASGKASSQASYDNKMAAGSSSSAGIAGNGGSAYAQDSAAMSASSKGSAKQSASYANSQEEKAAYNKNLQASSSQSASSSSSSSRNVNSQVNDKEEFHYAKTVNMAALKPQSTLNKAMQNELEAVLGIFGLELEDGSGLLADFSKANKKTYTSYSDAMEKDGDKFKAFLKMKRPNASYVGIGTLEIGYNPQKDNVGEFRCGLNTGTISIIPLKTTQKLPGGSLKTQKASDPSVEGCLNNIRILSAGELGDKVGSTIEKTARNKAKAAQQGGFD